MYPDQLLAWFAWLRAERIMVLDARMYAVDVETQGVLPGLVTT